MMQTHLFSLFATIFAASFATNAPVLQRRDDQQVLGPGTLGWRSITAIGTSTSYNQRTCSPGTTWNVAGDGPTKYGCCVTGNSCVAVATACIGGYRIYSNAANPASSSYCSLSCYRDEVLQSMGDTNSPTFMYWCGSYTTGGTVYRTSPAQAAATLTTESVLSEQTNSASNTPPSSSPKKGVPIGAIAGGAAGGVAVLILAGGLFVFLQRRRTAQQPKEAYPPIYNSEGHNQEHRDSQIHELPVDAHGQVSKAFDVYKSSDEPINELQGSEPPARTR